MEGGHRATVREILRDLSQSVATLEMVSSEPMV